MKKIFIITLLTLLTACATKTKTASILVDGAPNKKVNLSSIHNAIPKHEALSHYGNPDNYTVFGKTYHVLQHREAFSQRGAASWYGTKFDGQRTSSGEPYDMFAMTAAHKTLPIPSYVKVHNLDNDREIIVKVNDRGPFHEGRIIDLSYVAAQKLGIMNQGTGQVEITVIDTSDEVLPTHLYLQVGAFSSQQNAEALALRIKDNIEQTVSLSPSQTADRTIYKVRIGPLANAQLKQSIQQKLFTLGLGKAIPIIQ